MRQDRVTKAVIERELAALAEAATSASRTGAEWTTDYDYAPDYGGYLLWLYPVSKCRKAEGLPPGVQYQIDCVGRLRPTEARAAIVALAGWIKRGSAGVRGWC